MSFISGLDVSVIIPTYNRKDWLVKSLNSVLNQSAPVGEIIVVDDGSSDGTEEFIHNYPEVEYLKTKSPRQGPSTARNLGAYATTKKYLAFLDSDDEWHKEKIAKQIKSFQANSDSRFCYTNETWIRNGRKVNLCKHHQKIGGQIYLDCIPLCFISASSVLIERELFLEIGAFDESIPLAEDYDLWLRIASKHDISYLNEPLIHKYGGHEDQLSKSWGMDRYRVITLEKMMRQEGLPKAWQRATLLDLIRRLKILILTFKKYDRHEEVLGFEEKLSFWLKEIQFDKGMSE